jgi:hypothetical protein
MEIRTEDDAAFLTSLAQQMTRITLASFSGSLVPSSLASGATPIIAPLTASRVSASALQAASEISQISLLVVSRYPFAPVITYLVLLYIYSCLSAIIFFWAIFQYSPRILKPNGHPTNANELVSLWLRDCLCVVGALFAEDVGSGGTTGGSALGAFSVAMRNAETTIRREGTFSRDPISMFEESAVETARERRLTFGAGKSRDMASESHTIISMLIGNDTSSTAGGEAYENVVLPVARVEIGVDDRSSINPLFGVRKRPMLPLDVPLNQPGPV